MKKLISWLIAAAMTMSSMSALTAGAADTLSYTNEFASASDAWTNSNAKRGTVTVDETNGWLVINNQAASEEAGSFEGYYGTTMDFTDKYVKINTTLKFDDFVAAKGLTFRPSGTIQWAATNTSGALTFMGTSTGKTLTAGEWYNFELKMDVTGDAASLIVTDKNGEVYNSGLTTMTGDFASMTSIARLGAIVFQDSAKTKDAVLTIDRYELSEITKLEMYPLTTVYSTEFTAADGDATGTEGSKGNWGYNSTRGTITMDTANEVMEVASIANETGGHNALYTLNNTLSLVSFGKAFEIDTKVMFNDFNSQKQFNVRNSNSTVPHTYTYASVETSGALKYAGTSAGVTLSTGAYYNFKFMADPATGKAYLLVTDADGNTVYDSSQSGHIANADTIKAMDNIARVGFFAAKNTTTASSFTVDSYTLKEILPADIPETVTATPTPTPTVEPTATPAPAKLELIDDFTTAENIDTANAGTKGKWAIDQTARGTVAHDAEDGTMVITNNNASGGVVKGEYTFNSNLDVTDKAIDVTTKVKFDDFNSAKALQLRINSGTTTATSEYVSVTAAGAMSFIGNSTGVTLLADTWYTFKFQAAPTEGKFYLLVTDENGNTVYDSSTGVVSLTTSYGAMFASMTTIAKAGFGIAKSASSIITVDDYSLTEISAEDIPEMFIPDPSVIVSEDFSENIWTNTAATRGTVTHDAANGTMIVTNKQVGSEGFPDAGSMNADYFLPEAVEVADSVLEIKSTVKFDDFNTDKGLELRIKTSSSEDATHKSTHQYASVAPETGELIFMGTYTGVKLTANAWYDFTFVMNTSVGYGNLLVKDANGAVVYDSTGKTLNWATVRALAYNQMLTIERIGFTVFASEECDSTMTVDSCTARLVTDEEELAAMDFTSSVHATTPMITLDDELTTITATITTQVFKEANVGKSYKGYFAMYNDNGELLGVKSMSATTAMTKETVTETMALSDEATVIKAFLWDADADMKTVIKSGLYEDFRPVEETE